jgi:hypothetical protein
MQWHIQAAGSTDLKADSYESLNLALVPSPSYYWLNKVFLHKIEQNKWYGVNDKW